MVIFPKHILQKAQKCNQCTQSQPNAYRWSYQQTKMAIFNVGIKYAADAYAWQSQGFETGGNPLGCYGHLSVPKSNVHASSILGLSGIIT